MHIDIETIATEAVLARGSGVALLTEGSIDTQLYEEFLDGDTDVTVIACWTKDNAVGAVGLLEAAGDVRVLAIVDADFGHLTKRLPDSENVFVTDEHDVEMMMVKTEAFYRVVRQLGSRPKIEEFPGDLRELILERAKSVGCFRYYSDINGLGLRFTDLRYNKFVSRKDLEFTLRRMVEIVLSRSQAKGLRVADIHEALNDLSGTDLDTYQVCCGHDVLEILGIALRKVIGNRKVLETKEESLGQRLCLAYRLEDYKRTRLYSQVSTWSENRGYPVFV